MRRIGLRVTYQKPRTTVSGDPSMRFPCLVDLWEVTAVDQVLATDIPTSLHPTAERLADIWWRSWISTPGMCSAVSSPKALIGFCMEALAIAISRSVVVGGRRFCTLNKGASSPQQTLWTDSGPRRSGSAGQEGSAVTLTPSLSSCGGLLTIRRCICLPTAMAGRLKSICPASCGGAAM
jgi:hypothetical protein